MNEHETSPQRPPAGPDRTQPEPTAELPRDATQPQWGQSDPAAHDAGAHWAPTATGSGAPADAATSAPADAGSGAPAGSTTGGTHDPDATPAEQGAAPTTAPPYQGGAWQPQHQQPWNGHAGYGVPGQQAHYAAAQHPNYDPATQRPYDTAQQPTYDQGHQPTYDPAQHPHYNAPQQAMPPWAQPVGDQPQRRPSRVGRTVALGAMAVLLMLGSGGFGAWAALALDDDNGTVAASNTRTLPASPAKVLDRSSLSQIAAAVEDSVVSIKTESGEGSGVVLTADGFVLSNNHVVAGAQGGAGVVGGSVNVVFANGKSAVAKIVGTDPRTDLAVVKAEGVSGLSPATLGDSAAMQVGDTVLALGSPLGLQGSVTSGIISAKDRIIETGRDRSGALPQQSGVSSMSGLLQTDAAINPGNSGGALVNTDGQVIGINTAILTSGGGQGNIGVGFAIPSNKAKQVAEQLKAGKKVSHPVLGVSVTPAEGGGAVIKAVTPDGPAAKAGLKVGDVITQVNGQPANDSDDVVGIVQAGKVGDQLQVTYTRDGAQQSVTATLAEAS
ncbi:MAG TPA: trypsin-like peptidase domain-containing protein [Catenuloplanes sp.]|jgi:putative serine protease PepD